MLVIAGLSPKYRTDLRFFELEFSLHTGFWYIPALAVRFTCLNYR